LRGLWFYLGYRGLAVPRCPMGYSTAQVFYNRWVLVLNLAQTNSIMKNLITCILLSIVLLGCKKKSTLQPSSTQSTDLKLTIENESNSFITEGSVSVTLYKTETDWINKTNAVGVTTSTDPNGIVTFKNLEAINYYIDANKGSLNNYFKASASLPNYYTTTSLTANTENSQLVFIKKNAEWYLNKGGSNLIWKLVNKYVNGTITLLTTCESQEQVSFNNDGTFNYYSTSSCGGNSSGTWSLSLDESTLYITENGNSRSASIDLTNVKSGSIAITSTTTSGGTTTTETDYYNLQ
jgi:hypothetical protein